MTPDPKTVSARLRDINGLGCIMTAAQGFEVWKAKPHNAKWFRKIDGTPIPNDIPVCIANQFAEEFTEPAREAADLIDAQAAEIERLKALNMRIVANNARLQAVYEAAKAHERFGNGMAGDAFQDSRLRLRTALTDYEKGDAALNNQGSMSRMEG